MRDTAELKADIKARVNVPTLYRHLGGRVKVGDRVAHCFNASAHAHGDKNASMQLHPDGFKCHGCGIGGDAIELVIQWRGVDFKAALEELATFAGISRPAQSTSTRPGLRATRPRARAPSPPRPQPAPSVLELQRRLWGALCNLELNEEACLYLKARGISEHTAHNLGVRPADLGLLVGVLSQFDKATTKAAGWRGDKGPWWPLHELYKGDKNFKGVLIPAWPPDAPLRPSLDDDESWTRRREREVMPAPEVYRWRLFKPITVQRRPLKTLAMPGQPVLPLGIHVPDLWLDEARSSRLVIVCEGEPDWMSLYDAMQTEAGVLGLCDVARGWSPACTGAIQNARYVVVMAHDTEKGRRLFEGLWRALVTVWGPEEASRRCIRWLVDEDNDCNDLHRAGLLRDRIRSGLTRQLEELSKERPYGR